MTGWTVMLRGIRFRAGRSLLVLVIATVAVASAVATAGYIRAAQQSVLTDGLRSAPVYQTDLVVGGDAGLAGAAKSQLSIDQAQLAINQGFARHPLLRTVFAKPVAAQDTDTFMSGAGVAGGLAWLAYRDNVCAHVAVSGRCPDGPGQVMISKRSAQKAGIRIGAVLRTEFGKNPSAGPMDKTQPDRYSSVHVVGLYTPRDSNEDYWGGNAYFASGEDPDSPTKVRMDSVFTNDADDVMHDPNAAISLHVELPLRASAVTSDDVPGLRSDLSQFSATAGQGGLNVDTAITLVLNDVASSQHALATTIPVVAVPLVVLSLFVLFLVVTALTDERSPEIALAKLRGYPAGRASRFGMGEMLMLIVLATPLGIIVGFLVAAVAANTILAAGTRAELRWPIFAAGIAAMIAGCVAAWLATRSTLQHGVLSLLRRVPPRTGWRAGLGLGIAIALVAASLVAAFMNRKSPIAWLAAPSIALIAGLLAARLLAIAASVRLRSATRRGKLIGIISGAWLARQAGRSRVVAVLTVAVSLLVFGAVGWDVGTTARSNSADDTLGADRVYSVVTSYPTALLAAVHQADPSGNSMAVARTRQFYDNAYVELVGVETAKLAAIGRWRGHSSVEIDRMGTALRPALAPKVTVHGTMSVAITTTARSGNVALSAMVEPPGQPPVEEPLGRLALGTRTYTTLLAGCPEGCRFLGLTVGRVVGPTGRVGATLQVHSIVAPGYSVHDFSDPHVWGSNPSGPGEIVDVSAGKALRVQVSTNSTADEVIEYRDSPQRLPVVVSGGSKAANKDASGFTFPDISGSPDPMTVVGRSAVLPRAGADGLLFDLGVGVSLAERSGTLADATNIQYEVWANDKAPADLAARLSGNGITVLQLQTISQYLDELGRGAPTLSLWFYLFAGGLALILAVGVVLLGAYVGAASRIYEYSALKVAGVRPGLLRRSVIREYRTVLGIALVVGVAAGLVSALIMLPSIPLVTVGQSVGTVPYGSRMLVLYVALVLTVVAMAAVVLLALRVLGRATPERLREGVR